MLKRLAALLLLAGLSALLLSSCQTSPYYGISEGHRSYVPKELR